MFKRKPKEPSPDDLIIKIKPDGSFFSRHKKLLIILGIVLGVLVAGALVFFLVILPKLPTSTNQPRRPQVTVTEEPEPPHYYSLLSGEEITDESYNSLPTFCIQIPNGLDVAQPRTHVGLSQAPIVFEAIAEAGITRFAAIFQNPTSGMIGPIRSLRTYYLDWDVPFDCTIVHAGGSYEAIIEARAYRDLTENYAYMYRDYSNYAAPNNLFTSPALLNQFNADAGYTTSAPTAFPRLTPAAAQKALDSALQDALPTTAKDENGVDYEVPAKAPLVTAINLNFGYNNYFNLSYTYDAASNSYLRAYATGEIHYSYTCPESVEALRPANDCGTPTQLAPKVVIAMMVNQWTDWDGYHQAIATSGSGEAYVFQNGTAQHATWSKASRAEQITFTDDAGQPISFIPGQIWISALPTSTGSVNY